MNLTEGQKEQILIYVKTNMLNPNNFKNYLKRETAEHLNVLMMAMAQNIIKFGNIHEDEMNTFLVRKFFDSDATIKRKLKKIKSLGIFEYDEYTREFTFPDALLKKIGYLTEPIQAESPEPVEEQGRDNDSPK